MEKKHGGVIYILTNPSFKDYVKIGYADDIEKRLAQLNRSECVPFAFRVYATYEVDSRLSDLQVHRIIDRLNPDLRSIEEFEGKKRVREFYAMSPEDAYSLFEAIAEINGLTHRLKRIAPTQSEIKQERAAEEIREASAERAANFKFSMCGINPGDVIEYYNDPAITCTVVDDRRVEYNGEVMSLTGLARLLTGQQKIAGPRFFKYKGEWLNDIRHRNGF